MHSYFKNKTKAEVLIDLNKKKLKFKIPKTYYFNVADWKKNYNSILVKIFFRSILLFTAAIIAIKIFFI